MIGNLLVFFLKTMKIFRNFRRQGLSEQRITRYSVYALGEIFLVVIGILIALKINTWNEARSDRLTECAYYQNLLADLELQDAFLDRLIEFDRVVISNGDGILERFKKSGHFDVDSLLFGQIGILNNRRTFQKHNAVFTELLSTGNLNLIREPELKQEILLYFQQLDQYETIMRQNNEYIDNHFAPLALQLSVHSTPSGHLDMYRNIIEKGYVRPEISHLSTEGTLYYQAIAERLGDPLNQLNFFNQVQYRYRISLVHLSLADDLQNRIQRLRANLQHALQACP